MLRDQPSLPTRRSCSVTQPRFGLSAKTSTALSTVSSAIERYVVHLPPAIVSRPLSLTWIMWLRTRPSVLAAFGLRTSGRRPDHALSTSPRRTLMSGLR